MAVMAPRTILVADDDPGVTAILVAALRQGGFKVLTARDAMQAMLVTRKNVPDAIVLDIQMPGGTGLNVLKQVKASNATSQIPVIVISSTSDPKLPETVLGLGAEAFMPKPTDLVKL